MFAIYHSIEDSENVWGANRSNKSIVPTAIDIINKPGKRRYIFHGGTHRRENTTRDEDVGMSKKTKVVGVLRGVSECCGVLWGVGII